MSESKKAKDQDSWECSILNHNGVYYLTVLFHQCCSAQSREAQIKKMPSFNFNAFFFF